MWKDKGLQLVMLPTDNKVNALRGYADRSLLFRHQENYQILESEGDLTCYYYLYLLSDEEIKEGDWTYFISIDDEGIEFPLIIRKKVGFQYMDSSTEKKVIASTDPSLNLPSFPSSFLEEYVKRYNSKKSLEVEIEYMSNSMSSNKGKIEFEDLVIDDDNTISIRFKKEKKYSKSEVEELCRNAFKAGEAYRTSTHLLFKEPSINENTWLKENLK